MSVAMSIKEELIKASEIISKAASKEEENTESSPEKAETGTQPENTATETEKETEPVSSETGKAPGKVNLPAILLGIACIIELIIIVLLLIF